MARYSVVVYTQTPDSLLIEAEFVVERGAVYPHVLTSCSTREEAEALAERLREAGAHVEVTREADELKRRPDSGPVFLDLEEAHEANGGGAGPGRDDDGGAPPAESMIESSGAHTPRAAPPVYAPPVGATRTDTSSGFSAPVSPDAVAVEVFYGTTRNRTFRRKPERRYGHWRATRVDLGRCVVTLPTDRRLGELPRPHWWKFEFREDPAKHVMLRLVERLAEDAFFGAVNGRIGDHKEALVFVHGYNTSFADAARRTAQLAYDLHFPGAPLFFSWPSRGKLTAYPADEATIEATTPHLRRFLEDVSARSGAERIHLIGHSMGNRALTEVLERLGGERGDRLFQEVILAAPDIDAEVFRNLAAAMSAAAHRVTLYASSRDKALAASEKFHLYPRAGDSGEEIVVVPGVDTVDAAAMDTDFLDHAYFAENRSVVSDMFNLVRNGLPPNRRPGLHAVKRDELTYWRFTA
ncbi:MAG TPA: alpha/beta hydrolase [Gemmatimonadales bacterium]